MSAGTQNWPTVVRRRLTVRGQVQGVGFRPFVYRLAGELAVGGFVRNDGAGVTMELQGSPAVLDQFVRRLHSDLPPAARIDHLHEQPVEPLPPAQAGPFQILLSDHRTGNTAGAGSPAQADVAVDLATCDDCLRELFDPENRRFGYPFINCTNCGPRYSIVRDVPYDRAMTTMAGFAMCPACQAEYDNPQDRRFHAQPNACPVCGPQIWFASPQGERIHREGTKSTKTHEGDSEVRLAATRRGARSDESQQAIVATASALLDGQIVAIRGVGGFHLAVRADQDQPVARLRERKNREHKPLALMVRDLAAAEQLVVLTDAARGILLSPQRPIVIARRRADAPVSRHVATGTDSLGIMLPYTPLHHLLLAELERQGSEVGDRGSEEDTGTNAGGSSAFVSASRRLGVPASSSSPPPLVMTSGNIADEPILAGNDEALAGLGHVADLFLLHDRPIERRIDDSVVEIVGSSMLPLRRARGYVPVGMDLPVPAIEPGLAVGGELKNTVAIVRNRGQIGQAVLSEHVGDLKDGRAYRHFEQVIAHLLQITHTVPAWIAHDLHPMYLSSTWARRQGLRLIGVQHHHAHIASCLAEHARTGPVIGIAGDGVGYGNDGAIWGGEILLADLAEFRRIGRVRPIGLPGGDAAAVRTGRPAVAWLFDATAGNVPGVWLDRLLPDPAERDVVLKQLSEGFNCPASSAIGRFFDAAAAILGIAQLNHFEAEAPIALEAAIEPGCDETLPFAFSPSPAEDCPGPGKGAGNSSPSPPGEGRGEGPAQAGVLGPRKRAGQPLAFGSSPLPNPPPGGRESLFEIDLRPTALALIERVEAGQPAGRLAAAFHNTIAAALAAAAERASELTGLRTVAASGGVFCNRYLTLRLADLLVAERGFELLTHRQVPANDGGLALGQAVVAAARLAGFTSDLDRT